MEVKNLTFRKIYSNSFEYAIGHYIKEKYEYEILIPHLYEELVKDPENFNVRFDLALSFVELERYAEAKVELNKIANYVKSKSIKLDELNRLEYYLYLSYVLRSEDKWLAAKACLVIGNLPDNTKEGFLEWCLFNYTCPKHFNMPKMKFKESLRLWFADRQYWIDVLNKENIIFI